MHWADRQCNKAMNIAELYRLLHAHDLPCFSPPSPPPNYFELLFSNRLRSGTELTSHSFYIYNHCNLKIKAIKLHTCIIRPDVTIGDIPSSIRVPEDIVKCWGKRVN